jgi:hypothetical protein
VQPKEIIDVVATQRSIAPREASRRERHARHSVAKVRIPADLITESGTTRLAAVAEDLVRRGVTS